MTVCFLYMHEILLYASNILGCIVTRSFLLLDCGTVHLIKEQFTYINRVYNYIMNNQSKWSVHICDIIPTINTSHVYTIFSRQIMRSEWFCVIDHFNKGIHTTLLKLTFFIVIFSQRLYSQLENCVCFICMVYR